MGRKKIEIADEKICTKCGRMLPITEFYKTCRDSYFSECKGCNKDRMKTRYNKDPKKIREINNNWLKKLTDEEYEIFQKTIKANRQEKYRKSKESKV